jgi:hypothetical protein
MGIATLGYIVDSLNHPMTSNLDAWLASACADAERRGLPELKPLLESLARSTAALRAADAQDEAQGETQGETTTPPSTPAADAPASTS